MIGDGFPLRYKRALERAAMRRERWAELRGVAVVALGVIVLIVWGWR